MICRDGETLSEDSGYDAKCFAFSHVTGKSPGPAGCCSSCQEQGWSDGRGGWDHAMEGLECI